MPLVLVPAERVGRWVENFRRGHGATRLDVMEGALTGSAEDGSTFRARPPFGASYDGTADAASFAATLAPLSDSQLADLERVYDERIRAHVHDRW